MVSIAVQLDFRSSLERYTHWNLFGMAERSAVSSSSLSSTNDFNLLGITVHQNDSVSSFSF